MITVLYLSPRMGFYLCDRVNMVWSLVHRLWSSYISWYILVIVRLVGIFKQVIHTLYSLCSTEKQQNSDQFSAQASRLFNIFHAQPSTKFILLINVKMPIFVGILTFISRINTTPERLKARNFFNCRYFSFYE